MLCAGNMLGPGGTAALVDIIQVFNAVFIPIITSFFLLSAHPQRNLSRCCISNTMKCNADAGYQWAIGLMTLPVHVVSC